MTSSQRPLRAARIAACLVLLPTVLSAGEAQPQASLWKAGPELVPAEVGADAVERRVRVVDLGDLAWTAGSRAARVVDLELFDNERVTLALEYRGSARTGASVWFGELEGSDDHLALAVQGTSAAGTLRLGTEFYRLRPVAGGKHILAEIDENLFAGCGTEERSSSSVGTGTGAAVSPATSESLGPVTYAGTTLPTFDVLVAYTPQVKNASGGTNGALALIDLAVLETNNAYQKGNAVAAMRLVYAYEVSYNDSGNMGSDLSLFRGKTDGSMDEVHAFRTAYGADACHLLVNSGGYCGIASLMTNVSNGFKSSAFAVTARGCATGYYTFGHEFGHNFGCTHDTDNAGSSSKPYGYGYRTPNNQYRTVMAYSPGSRVPTFSSPLTTWNGWTMGTAAKEDNGRTLTENGPTIAGWYPTVTAIVDCNENGVDDGVELALGLATDLNGDGILDECASLFVDVQEISIVPGGTQTLTLEAGAANAGRVYLLLGSFSGTTPGFPLGGVTLALNPDSYTNLLLATGGSPLTGLVGVLDAAGNATESFILPGGIAPISMLTIEAHHAYVVFDASAAPVFASTPASLTFDLF
jgi:hypothetical protein